MSAYVENFRSLFIFLYFINFRCATVILLSQLLRTFFANHRAIGMQSAIMIAVAVPSVSLSFI